MAPRFGPPETTTTKQQVLRKPDPTPLELLEGAWGCVAGALAQVPGALEGLARAVVPQQAGPERPPAEPASASAL